jgi:hypothetical protein
MELVVISGATHLLPEPGSMEEIARLAKGWPLWHPGTDQRVRSVSSSAKSVGSDLNTKQ